MRLKLLACEILFREFCWAAARSPHRIDLQFLPKGLHDIGQIGMNKRLTETLDEVREEPCDAILLGYALCSNGLVGLKATKAPLVLPRAHDCITLFMGNKERYLDYFQSNPGVYFKTSGWIERGEQLEQMGPESIQTKCGIDQTYDELVAKYGEDNAKYLAEQFGDFTHNYSKLTFIEMGIEPDDRFEQQTQQLAEQRGWQFEKLLGDMQLVTDLVDGNWDEDRFLVVPPGHEIATTYDERIVKAVPSDAT